MQKGKDVSGVAPGSLEGARSATGNEAGCLISQHKEQITLCLNHSQALARSTPTARSV